MGTDFSADQGGKQNVAGWEETDMVAFLYIAASIIVFCLWMEGVLFILVGLYMPVKWFFVVAYKIVKWMVRSLYNRFYRQAPPETQPRYFTLPDGRIRYLP